MTIGNTPKKRLLFVVTQSELGGAQRFLYLLATRLDRTKYEVAVAAGSGFRITNHESRIISYELLERLDQDGFKTKRLKHLRREINLVSDLKSLFEMRRLIREFNPDCLFLMSSKAGFIGAFVSKFLIGDSKFKILYRVGGWSFNDPRPWWKRTAYRWLEKLSAPWKDYIIVNNKHDYDQAIKFSIKPKKEVVLIYNGIDPYKLDFLGKDEAKVRLYEMLPLSQKHASFLHKELTIGTIANFYPTKGLEYLIDSFSILNAKRHSDSATGRKKSRAHRCGTFDEATLNAVLLIIGDGPERENLELQIKDAGLQSMVFLTGQIPDAHKYLPAFDIFVLPSVKEGFPWALLEAMAAKLPVIATAVGAAPEIIEDGKNGFLVKPGDPQQLAAKIGEILANDHLRQELGIQAHQTALFKYNLTKMIEQFESIF